MFCVVRCVQLPVFFSLCNGSNGVTGGRSAVMVVRLGHIVLCSEGGAVTGLVCLCSGSNGVTGVEGIKCCETWS